MLSYGFIIILNQFEGERVQGITTLSESNFATRMVGEELGGSGDEIKAMHMVF